MTENEQKQQTDIEFGMNSDQIKKDSRMEQTKSAFLKVTRPILIIFHKILPLYEPRIDIDEKIVKNETIKEHAIVRHFSELQLIFGFLITIAGIAVRAANDTPFAWFISIFGLFLVFTAYEMEEIYVTSHRIIVRRVGFIERIIRVPSDEDHALNHLVSFHIGRAPANIILTAIGLLGYFVLFTDAGSLLQLVVIIASSGILAVGLRINRRAVTLSLAGGLNILLGVRKGIPKRIIVAIQKAMYEDQIENTSGILDEDLGDEFGESSPKFDEME